MMGILIEAVLVAFVIGGILGAVSALHLSKSPVQIPVRIRQHQVSRQRRF